MAPTTEAAAVRGRAKKRASILALIDPDIQAPADHPSHTTKRFADAALVELSPWFDVVSAADGQGPALVPPERSLKASLLMSVYSSNSFELEGD